MRWHDCINRNAKDAEMNYGTIEWLPKTDDSELRLTETTQHGG